VAVLTLFFLFVLLVVLPAILVVVIVTVAWFRQRAGRRQRGFEVKPNTGGDPVLKQKANDHG
jgi:heme/copper-type cytochrome/quinol oxidase subunit 2